VSALPEPRSAVTPGACPICGTAVGADETRCPECNCDLAGTAGRPMYSKVALIWTILAFVVVYAVVVVVVVSSN